MHYSVQDGCWLRVVDHSGDEQSSLMHLKTIRGGGDEGRKLRGLLSGSGEQRGRKRKVECCDIRWADYEFLGMRRDECCCCCSCCCRVA